MESSRVRARDVALKANVSLSAVSRTFTPGASVSADTRARVIAVAHALGYRPNILARGLTTRRTQLIGVVLVRAGSPFFELFLGCLHAALEAVGQRILLQLIEHRGGADAALDHALDYSVDGVIFVSSAPSPAAAEAAAGLGVPIVVMDRGGAVPHASHVWTDGASIGRKVAAIFVAEGRTRAACVSGFRGRPQPKEIQAFAKAMHAATGRKPPILEGGPSYEDGVAAAYALAAQAEPCDCVFTATDFLALGIYDAARYRLSWPVPAQLAIIGLGDTGPTSWISHAVTTVRPPVEALVQTAVSTLMSHIENPGMPPARTTIDCDVISRDTTLSPLTSA